MSQQFYEDIANQAHPEGCKCPSTDGGGDCAWCRIYYNRYVSIDEDTGLMTDGGACIQLVTEGRTEEEMLEDATLFFIDRDGGTRGDYQLIDYTAEGTEVYEACRLMIRKALMEAGAA